LYRVSIDFHAETAQLAFNFSSLQVYELLLVGTAIFLASRRIWYDSTLLVVLENLFLLVPFILVSQAALIDRQSVWALCILAAALVAFRTGSTRKWLPALPLTPRSVGIGSVILLANAALPIVYRTLQESKVGTKPDFGPAYMTNEMCWLLG